MELSSSGGALKEITLQNRLEFVEKAEAFKKQEFYLPVRIAAYPLP